MTPAERLATLFAGRSDYRGALPARLIRCIVTPATFARHLAGQTSLGIYPLLADGTVRWACLDFDRLSAGRTPEQAWQAAFAEMRQVRDVLVDAGWQQGVWPERSKSKGGHLWLFLSDWTEAALVRRMLIRTLDVAGIAPATVEIFPKQDRLTEAAPFGNFVHLPYFGGAEPGTRVMVDWEFGQPVELADFLDRATPFPVGALDSVAANLADLTPPGVAFGPATNESPPVPCTAKIEALRLGDHGNRNSFALLLGRRYRREGMAEDAARRRLAAWNDQHTEPLPESELQQAWRQSAKYRSFGCEWEIVRPLCDPACSLYPTVFGTPKNGKSGPALPHQAGQDSAIGPLTIIYSDEKTYRLWIDGLPAEIPARAAGNWREVRNLAIAQIDRVPRVAAFEKRHGNQDWLALLGDLLATADTEYPAPDTTRRGVLAGYLAEYFRDSALAATDPLDVERGHYLVAGDRALFRPEHILRHLNVNEPRAAWTRAELSQLLEETADLKRVLKSLRGKKVRLWSVCVTRVTAIHPDEAEMDT